MQSKSESVSHIAQDFKKNDLNTYVCLSNFFEDTCRKFGSHSAVSNFGSQLTYTELYTFSTHFGAWLQENALDKGEFIHLVARKKDMIDISGFKVYPNEVEAVLLAHSSVKEAAVVGVIDDIKGETVKAFVVRSVIAAKMRTQVTAKELIDFCHQSLTAYKVPNIIIFVESLPKSNIGKLLRRALWEEKRTGG